MWRLLVTLTLLLAATSLVATTRFVAPLPGAQVIGLQVIEVKTSALSVDRVDFFVDGVLSGVARKGPYRLVHDFGTSADARHIVAKVWSDSFKGMETAEITTSAILAAESLTVDVVEVPLRARASRQLKASDLRIRENGRDQAIRELLPQRSAAHFIFIIDRSLSMGDGRFEAALRAIDGIRPMLRSGDRISALLFNHNVSKLRAFAANESLVASFGATVPSGGTSLRDAMATLPAFDRTYAIVLTDGGDRNSLTSEEDALRAISGTRVVVDALVLDSASRFLQKAASNTGGSILRADKNTVASQLRALIADINSRYVAVYQSTGGARGWRSVAVTSSRRGVEIVTARKGYYAR